MVLNILLSHMLLHHMEIAHMVNQPQDVLSIVELQGFAFFLVHSERWG